MILFKRTKRNADDLASLSKLRFRTEQAMGKKLIDARAFIARKNRRWAKLLDWAILRAADSGFFGVSINVYAKTDLPTDEIVSQYRAMNYRVNIEILDPTPGYDYSRYYVKVGWPHPGSEVPEYFTFHPEEYREKMHIATTQSIY